MKTVNLALAGNPNSGKTTLFNALTGARQRVGNYPGVTVERKEGTVRRGQGALHLVDLPGCYSLTAYSPEELVARRVLIEERPQAVVQVADACALERSLYLTVQFLELGFPVVLALNMMDEVKRKNIRIDAARLSKRLGVPVVQTVARAGRGKEELLDEAAAAAARGTGTLRPFALSYGPDVDPVLGEMTAIIAAAPVDFGAPARWVALKYIEGDEEVVAKGRALDPELSARLLELVDELREHLQATMGTYPEAIVADYRYGFINAVLRDGVLERSETGRRFEVTEVLDRVLTHRLLGPVIMLGVLYGLFELTFTVGEIPMGWLEALFGWLSASAEAALPEGPVRSLIVSGIIDGVGGVLGFVPLIAVMFFAITFLEDAGYMARMAYMLDRVFRLFGLHGCSVMPFLVSGGMPGGCAVPGVMATRTLRSPREKLATLLTAPFMTCGAKVPVFILLAAAFFPGQAAKVMFCITLGAWAMALVVSRLLRSTILRGESTPFVMELPPYRMPTLRGLCIHTWERAWAYIRKAGTVILAVSILIWAAMTYPGLPDEQAATFDTARATAEASLSGQALESRLETIDLSQEAAALKHSFAGRIGTSLEPVTEWAGFDWRTNIALVGGFAAKEVIVSTLGTAYSLGEVDPEETGGLVARIQADPTWSAATAVSLIVFVLLYAPCFVTVVTMAKESSWRWAALSMAGNTALAFGLAVAIYQVMA